MTPWLGIADRADVSGAAVFSPDRRYRYVLRRRWKARRTAGVLFVGLNPSTADARVDDPTIRRMAVFANDWGFGQMTVCNVFAFRATDPRKLKRADDPVGPENDRVLRREARRASAVVVCWGNHATWQDRAAAAFSLLDRALMRRARRRLLCFGLTGAGQPKHPLYLPRRLKPVPTASFAAERVF